MASTYLSKTFGTATDRKKFTVSLWFKRSGLSSTQMLFAGTNGSTDEFLYLTGSGNNIIAECASGQLVSSANFRDTNGWYHVVYKFDSAQATAGDRTALYVNGTEISYSTETQPSQNATPNFINNSNLHAIGRRGSSADAYFDGSITHFHFCDGYAYDASDFGQFNSDGVWTPKTSPSVTYGTNGFFLKMENSGSMGTDSSGNANNFTVNGTLTQTIDSPSNVYCCLNALAKTNASMTFNHGNTTATTANGVAWLGAMGTLGANKGKWYAEAKITDPLNFSIGYAKFGGTFNNNMNTLNGGYLGIASGDSYGFWGNGASANLYYGSVNYSYGSVTSANDIMMLAMDLDNGNLYWGKNGTWFNSSNPATSTSPAISGITVDEFMTFAIGVEGGSAQWNFGNGYFGTSPVASAGSNGNGSIFEYDVPTGYYALNTKNLATYG